ncbi:MAG: M48 family metallopeptidase [Gammaproteobacteria bacterium]|nr:M48 family metallopeptidase [Gammaproteobacteria bacterium]
MKFLVPFLIGCLLSCPVGAAVPSQDDLPDIGSPSSAALSRDHEEQIGREIMRMLRDAGQILDDPEITEYVQTVGDRLVGQSQETDYEFRFFVVDDPHINAFALPGGYIGVNSGLVLASETESELAGVIAHEIAHVTQKHIARRVEAGSRAGLVSTAALLAAILVGAATGASPDALQGAIAITQGTALQQQINFTRSNESEADRVGIGILASAGFDPHGMPAFFETMSRRQGLAMSGIPEFILTHPAPPDRIAESRARAAKYPDVEPEDSPEYELTRARIRVLSAKNSSGALQEIRSLQKSEDTGWSPDALSYGEAIALMRAGRPDEAVSLLAGLRDRNQNVIAYHSALGQAQIQSNQPREAMDTFRNAIALFPRNVPLTIRYSQALMRFGEPQYAHELLLDLLNNVPPTPDQAHLIALAASAAGDTADAYYYMSEYHVLNGNLPLAADQLRLALAVPDLDEVQRSRFQARLDLIRENLPERRRRSVFDDPEPDTTDVGPVSTGASLAPPARGAA